jgi:hypothetical protein
MAAAALAAVFVRALGLPEQLGTFFAWVIVLLPALLLFSFLARFAISPLVWVLTVSIRILSRMQRGAGFARGE